MGRYIEWDDIANRYPELDTLGGADELAPIYIDYAEALVDGLLADYYTTPFSNNNMTVRDLAIDACYAKAARFKFDNATAIYSMFLESISMVQQGKLNMINTSGEQITGIDKNIGIYSSTQSYHTAFGIDDPINWSVDSSYIEDVQDDRS